MQFDIVHYIHFVIQKVVIEVLIRLAAGMTVVKMVKIEGFLLETTDIDQDMYKKIAIHLVYYLVITIFNTKNLLILHYKLFKLV